MRVSEAKLTKKASKNHHCTWCWEIIEEGSSYWHWFTFGEATTARMHPECYNAQQKADLDQELPIPGTYRRGCWCGENEEFCHCNKEAHNE